MYINIFTIQTEIADMLRHTLDTPFINLSDEKVQQL